uniref:Uncharacterized protein n=1 Tax=Anguilla anguilla TaxID=7936 RepID=A0A0E9S6J1_ANGAN
MHTPGGRVPDRQTDRQTRMHAHTHIHSRWECNRLVIFPKQTRTHSRQEDLAVG